MAQLHEKYSPKGLSVLAFPCNQFGKQEPGSNAEVKSFAQDKFDAKYDLFAKIDVKGDSVCPLYQWLQNQPPTYAIEWNFAKFLVDKQGQAAAHFKPAVEPMGEEITGKIEELLAKE